MSCNTRAGHQNGSCGHQPIRNWVLTGGLAVILLGMAPVIAQSETAPDPAGMVAQELSELGVKSKTAVLPSDRALEATNAIKRGDYEAGKRIAEGVLAGINEFMAGIGRGGNDPLLLSNLNSWLAREPGSAIAHLIRARYLRQAGWEARSEGTGSTVPKPRMDEFVADTALAKADIQAAIKLQPRNPWSYYAMMDILSGQGNTSDMGRVSNRHKGVSGILRAVSAAVVFPHAKVGRLGEGDG
jgi:Domain of unknown function (DUF4034)